jgi:predicted permease
MTTNESIWKKKYLKVFTLFSIIGLVLGAIGGYIYYLKVGCSTGSCAISSNPYLSILWGAAMGYLLGDMFNKKEKSE